MTVSKLRISLSLSLLILPLRRLLREEKLVASPDQEGGPHVAVMPRGYAQAHLISVLRNDSMSKNFGKSLRTSHRTAVMVVSVLMTMSEDPDVLFSHPRDYTPVCATEFAIVARFSPKRETREVKPIGLSVDSIDNHFG